MTLLKWMAAVAVASGVVGAADAAPSDPDLLPWGERLSDYRQLTGQELREAVVNSYILLDESRRKRRTRHGSIGSAFCESGRRINVSDGDRLPKESSVSVYYLRWYEYCVPAYQHGLSCYSIFKSDDGTFIQGYENELDRSLVFGPVVIDKNPRYCEKINITP